MFFRQKSRSSDLEELTKGLSVSLVEQKNFSIEKGFWVFPLSGFSWGKSCVFFVHFDLYCSTIILWLNL